VEFLEHVKKNLQARVFANYLSLASQLPSFLACLLSFFLPFYHSNSLQPTSSYPPEAALLCCVVTRRTQRKQIHVFWIAAAKKLQILPLLH
jgi:hypothetical protein